MLLSWFIYYFQLFHTFGWYPSVDCFPFRTTGVLITCGFSSTFVSLSSSAIYLTNASVSLSLPSQLIIFSSPPFTCATDVNSPLLIRKIFKERIPFRKVIALRGIQRRIHRHEIPQFIIHYK